MKYFKYKVNHTYTRPTGFQEATDAEDKIWQSLLRFHEEVDNINNADIAFIELNNASFYFNKGTLKRIWEEYINPRISKKDIPHVTPFTYVINDNDLSFIPSWINIWAYETECSHHAATSLLTTDSGCGSRMCMIPYVLTPGTNPAAGLVESTSITYDNFNSTAWKNRAHAAFIGSLQADGRPRISTRADQILKWQQQIGCDIYPDRSATEPNSTYSKYKFALIMRGDTPTRKAFYQAIAAGSFPVVTESAWQQYSELYRGHCDSLVDMVVVVPDDASTWSISKIQIQLETIIKNCDELLPRLGRWVNKYLDYDGGGVVEAAMLATIQKTQKITVPLVYLHELGPASYYRPTNVQVSEQEVISESNILESQYALEHIILDTIEKYPYRTACLEKAKAAIVPVHTFLTCWRQPNYYSVTDCVDTIKSALRRLPEWSSSTVPHYLGYGDVLWDDERVFIPHVQLPQNTTIISLETCNSSTKQASVPFPHGTVPDKIYSGERRLAVYVGREREAVCKYNIDYEIISTPGWHSTNTQNARIIKAYSEHKFSLQPHGDRATRRGFYQSIACGCIPVITSDCVRAYSEALATDVSRFCVIVPEWNDNAIECLEKINFNEMRLELPVISLRDRILSIMNLK